MATVDPKHLNKLDRRSTMLMEASRNPTEEDEKHEIVAMEQRVFRGLYRSFWRIADSRFALQPAWMPCAAVSVL